MQSGRAQFGIKLVRQQDWRGEGTRTGAEWSISGNIRTDSSDPFTPNYAGRSQTQKAGLSEARISCLQAPLNTQHFPVWNQLIAAIVRHDSRLLKFVEAGWEKGRDSMATLSDFYASLLYGVFCEFHKTQDAVFMA
jgi:hypothetical protein